MAKNDMLLIDGIIDARIEEKLPSDQRDEVFEYLTYQQALKYFDLSRDDLLSGSVDGKDDGGIDAIYTFINGHLITDISTIFWPKSNGEIEIYIFTCKHRDSFKQEPINNLIASLEELLNFSLDTKDMKGVYNSDVIEKRNIIIASYKKMATILKVFNLNIIYACRGNTSELSENIIARGLQVEALCKDCFSSCNIKFKFWGNEEILSAYRKIPDYSLNLSFQECLTQDEQYVLLTKLKDYYSFITNEEGKLKKHIFDSNVRDFMGLTSVNEDILTTLSNKNSTDFWWLNNGVTILSTGATIIGKSITIGNVQIVNGLQTSECIFRHFQKSFEDDNRYLLIKIITSQDASIRDSIIRATNNQTQVGIDSLHATDKIQRDIEDILFRSGLYYERRINFYSNQGIPDEKIFSPLYLAAGYTALILKLPHKAVTLKKRFMRDPIQYNKIFSEKINLKVWPIIAIIMRTTDKQLEKKRPKNRNNLESFLKSLRYILSFLTLSKLFRKFDFSVTDLLSFDISTYTEQVVSDTWDAIVEFIPTVWNKSYWRSKHYTFELIKKSTAILSIDNFKSIENRDDSAFEERKYKIYELDETFINLVYKKLPPQPWPIGINKRISLEISEPAGKVSQAISVLVESGVVYRQKDGVVYNKNGDIIAIDNDRIDKNY